MTTETLIFKWTYSPATYFEERVDLTVGYDVNLFLIDNGTVEIRCENRGDVDLRDLRQTNHSIVKNLFLGAQLTNKKDYQLSIPSTVEHVAAEGKGVTVFGEAIIENEKLIQGDVIIKDKFGNVLSDSKQERIDERNLWAKKAAQLVAKDALLKSLLKSHSKAYSDPDNELIYLYEIREALKKNFGNERKLRMELEITRTQYSRLGKLANDLPLKQGRHRGASATQLRDATDGELFEAREIASSLIKKYMDYLEQQNES